MFDLFSVPAKFGWRLSLAVAVANLAVVGAIGVLAALGVGHGLWLEAFLGGLVAAVALFSAFAVLPAVWPPLGVGAVSVGILALWGSHTVALGTALALVGLTAFSVAIVPRRVWIWVWVLVDAGAALTVLQDLPAQNTADQLVVGAVLTAAFGLATVFGILTSAVVARPEKALRTFLDQVGDGLVVIDDDSRIEAFMGTAPAMFGYEPGEVIGQRLDILIPPQYRHSHRGYLSGFGHGTEDHRGMGERPTLSALHRSGAVFPVEISISKIHLGDKHRLGAVVRDVSDRVAAEQAAHASDSRLRLITSVSHDIRTPLTAVLGFAEVLQAHFEEEGDAESQISIDTIVREAREIGYVLDDLLVGARPDLDDVPIMIERVQLVSEVSRLIKALNTEGIAELDARSEPVVAADALRVRQVVRNLVVNAFRHGRPPVRVEVDVDDEMGVVRVIDGGDGPPPDAVGLIFRMFITVGSDHAPGSSGLGLPVSRRLAQAMGGDVVYAKVTGLPTFTLSLPLN